MKVLMLTEVLRLGGGETVAIELANALEENRIETIFAAASGPLQKKLHKNIVFYKIPQLKIATAIDTLLALGNVIATVKPDVIHSHGATLSLLAGIAIRKTNAKAVNVLTRHNPFSRIPPLFASMLLRCSCDHVIVLSGLAFEQFRNVFIDDSRISVIPNFIDADAIEEKVTTYDKTAILEELNIERGLPVISMVGRLIPGKRFNLFINIVARCAARLKTKLCALIIGDGPLREELERQARDHAAVAHFRFLGYQSDVFKYLAISNLFLFTTAEEVLPLVLLEAAAAGVPIICSDIPQNRNIIEHGRTGFVVRHDEETYCDYIVNILENTTLAQQLSGNARNRIRNTFDKNVVMHTTIALYRKLLDQKQRV